MCVCVAKEKAGEEKNALAGLWFLFLSPPFFSARETFNISKGKRRRGKGKQHRGDKRKSDLRNCHAVRESDSLLFFRTPKETTGETDFFSLPLLKNITSFLFHPTHFSCSFVFLRGRIHFLDMLKSLCSEKHLRRIKRMESSLFAQVCSHQQNKEFLPSLFIPLSHKKRTQKKKIWQEEMILPFLPPSFIFALLSFLFPFLRLAKKK